MFFTNNMQQKVYSKGFVRTVLEERSAQYDYHLTLLMQEYFNTGNNGHTHSDTLKIFENYPEAADRILREIAQLVANPTAVTHENDWHDAFVTILKILSLYYRRAHKVEHGITAQDLINSIKSQQASLAATINQQQATEHSRIQQKIIEQASALRLRTDIEVEILNKLICPTPILSWKINPRYETGPFRTKIIREQVGMHEYKYTAQIPLFDELYRNYPDLLRAACNNPEQQPPEAIVTAETIAWQKKILLSNNQLRLPENVLLCLRSNPPRLPWELNEDNESAPGYQCQYWRGERHVTIPLRETLIKAYPELMQAAELNKQPGQVVTTIANRQTPMLFGTAQTISQFTWPTIPLPINVRYNEIEKAIGVNIGIIDHINLYDKSMLTCPITGCLMRDPVILGNTGRTFERAAIVRALQNRPNINPLDNSILTNADLAPNYTVRAILIDFLKSDDFNTRVRNHVTTMSRCRN